ncbi:MAG: VOC family protein [Fibrobacteria bacterium]
MSDKTKPIPDVKPIPDGYHSVTPYLSVRGASEAIAFYRKAFGAEEIYRLEMPGDKIGHAEIQIGTSRLMLADEFPDMPDAIAQSPTALRGTSMSLLIYVPDVDSRFKRAIDAGGKVKRPVQDQFYGDRSAVVEDPFGHIWTLATHVEDVSVEEMKRRMEAMPQV